MVKANFAGVFEYRIVSQEYYTTRAFRTQRNFKNISRNTKEVEKYVIMPDHIHMIIRLDNGAMWASTPTDEEKGAVKSNRVASIVCSIKTLSAKEIGEAVFQRSYYDHVIRNARDYEEIWEYIEYNPLKWLQRNGGDG